MPYTPTLTSVSPFLQMQGMPEGLFGPQMVPFQRFMNIVNYSNKMNQRVNFVDKQPNSFKVHQEEHFNGLAGKYSPKILTPSFNSAFSDFKHERIEVKSSIPDYQPFNPFLKQTQLNH
jgi:hypothetical protein